MRYKDIYANQKPEQEGKRKTSHQELALTAYNKGEKENREGREKGKEWNKGEGGGLEKEGQWSVQFN